MLYLLKNLEKSILASFLVLTLVATSVGTVYASSTSEFQVVINPGTLNIDIVDAAYAAVTSPAVAFSAATFSFACQATTGTFGTASQQIYVKNPDASDTGWTATLAASAPTALWQSTGSSTASFDFNDAGTSGCSDDTDTDLKAGQLTVNPSAGTLTDGACSSCTAANITKGSSGAFVEGTANSVTLLSAAAGSNDIGDWTLQGVTLSQTLPGEQAAFADYSLDLTLSVVAI